MKKYLYVVTILLILVYTLAYGFLRANFKSDYIKISVIDKVSYIDLDRDGVKEVLLEARGSVDKYNQEAVFLINGYLAKDKGSKQGVLDKDLDKIFGVFYKENKKWIPALLGVYSSKSYVLPGEDVYCDKLVAFDAIDLLKDGNKQIRLNFTHIGAAGGIDHYLFAFKNKKTELLYHSWHDRFGGDTTYDLEKGKIFERRELYIPFQIPTHYYTSLWAYSVLVWDGKNNRFESEKEWMEWNKDFTLEPDIGCGDTGKVIFETQKQYKDGQDKWRNDPIEVVKYHHPKFSGYELTYVKNGLAIVEAKHYDDSKLVAKRIYLYQPFYDVEDKSIWEEAYYGRAGIMGIVPI